MPIPKLRPVAQQHNSIRPHAISCQIHINIAKRVVKRENRRKEKRERGGREREDVTPKSRMWQPKKLAFASSIYIYSIAYHL